MPHLLAHRPLYAWGVMLVVFLLAAVAASGLIWRLEQDDIQDQRAQAANVMIDHAHALQRGIERALSATYALEALLRQGNGTISNFAAVGRQMLSLYPGVSSVSLAPAGTIRSVVPLAGNEKAVGLDLLSNPATKKEASIARDTGMLTLAGPFKLENGKLAAIGRLPVFVDGAEGNPSFWGFINVQIGFPEALEVARLPELAQQGFAYELWRMRPDSQAKQIIAASSAALNRPLEHALEVPNATWTLSIAPVKGWGDPLRLSLKSALGLIFSLLLALLAKVLFELRAHKQGLEALVVQRTAEVQASEARFRSLTQMSSDFYWETDAEHRFTQGSWDVNPRVASAWRTLIGKRRWEMPYVSPDAAGWEAHRAVMDKHSPFRDFQLSRLGADGTERFLSASGDPLFDKSGAFIGYRGVGTDITDRKRAESQLRLAASVFDYALEAITITDADANILAVNRSFTEITGYQAQEAIGKNPRILKSGRQGDDFYRAMWKALLSDGRWAGEIWNRRKDGRIYPEQISISAVRDGNGKTVNYVAVFSDLTQRVAAEEAIRTSERKYRTMFGGAPEGVLFVGLDRRIVEVNRRLTELLGYPAEEMLGRLPMDFTDEQNREIFETQLRLVTIRPQREYEIELRHKNGHNIPTHFSVSNLYAEDGSYVGALAFVTDLTERRRHEDQLRRINEELEQRVEERTHALQVANGELESFCYSVSHDLRAPLRAINGFTRLIEDDHAGSMDEHGRGLIQRVGAAAERMGRLIEDLLNLSRISRQEMHASPVDLSALAREVADELHAGEPVRRVEWLIGPKIRAKGDTGLLRVVLHNLLGNAFKYSSKRDTTRIEFGVAQKDGRPAYFVRDNGAGFDMAYADKLFRAFQRLHSPAEFPGTGIGLATVARIVHRHGGEVWAEGRVGEGSSFYFTL